MRTKKQKAENAHSATEPLVRVPKKEFDFLKTIETHCREMVGNVFLTMSFEQWIELLQSRMRSQMRECFNPEQGMDPFEIEEEIQTIAFETLEQMTTLNQMRKLYEVIENQK